MKADKRRLQEEVDEARQRNALYGHPGTLRLETLYHYRDRAAPSKRWRRLPGFRNVSVCSGAKKWKVLSPRYIGPVQVDGLVALTLENVWIYSQVFADDLRKGVIKPEWYEHRKWGFGQREKRRTAHNKPEFWYWQGQRMDEAAARKAFCKLYAELVVPLDEYQELHLMLKQGFNLQLFGYDAYDFVEQGKTLRQAIDEVDGKFGHELALYGLLVGERVWE